MDLHDARTMASALLSEHGLTARGWRLEFDRAKRRAGVCRYDTKVIGLSAPITRLHPEHEVRDTVLHEIAHALAGPRAKHGPAWVAAALRVGGSATVCVGTDLPTVPAAWVGVCSAGHSVERHRRPEAVLLCGRCRGVPDTGRVFEWLRHGRQAPMHPNYLAMLDALRSGRRMTLLPVGARGRIVVASPWQGEVGTVLKVGRTSYHVKMRSGVVRVPFAWVEPA